MEQVRRVHCTNRLSSHAAFQFANLAIALLSLPMSATAQSPPAGVIRSASGAEPWPAETVDAGPLPDAPREIAELQKAGNVTFVFYDAEKYRRSFSGETRFSIQFASDSEFRWQQVRDRGGKRAIVVRTSFQQPEFQLQHQILLPDNLIADNFFESPLVRHEFDHVRISIDPRFRKTFSKWLEEELKVVRIELEGPKTESQMQELVKAEMNERANRLFHKMLELIQIRYKELDKITNHGRATLPADFFER